MAENSWVTPSTSSDTFKGLLSQIVQNAAATAAGADKSPALVLTWVAVVRAAIQVGARVPLSQTTTTVPPEAERYVYVLAINDLTAGTPNLGAVVITMNGGVISPFGDIIKEARKYITDLRAGLVVPMPTLPMVTGTGRSIVNCATFYNASQQISVQLIIGRQYYFTLGANEVSLVCGTTTLTASGSFYATAATATITGAGASLVWTGLLQVADLAANLTRSGSMVGLVDLTTPGPYTWPHGNPELGRL